MKQKNKEDFNEQVNNLIIKLKKEIKEAKLSFNSCPLISVDLLQECVDKLSQSLIDV